MKSRSTKGGVEFIKNLKGLLQRLGDEEDCGTKRARQKGSQKRRGSAILLLSTGSSIYIFGQGREERAERGRSQLHGRNLNTKLCPTKKNVVRGKK